MKVYGYIRQRVRFAAVALMLALIGIVSMACGSNVSTPTPASAPQDGQTATPDSPKAAWEIEWEETLAKAQEEGRLTWSTNENVAVPMRPVFEEFGRRFDINVSFDIAPGGQQVDRILAERLGGRYEVNLFSAGGGSTGRMVDGGALQPIEPFLFHPEVVDTSLWWGGQHWYADAEERLSFSYAGSASPASQLVFYNTELISQEEIDAIDSDWDWVDLKWAGEIVALDPTGSIYQPGYADTLRYNWLGEAYIRRFFSDELDVTFVRDVRLATDGIISGRWSIGIMLGGIKPSQRDLVAQGAPLGFFDRHMPGEPKLLEADKPTHTIGLADRAPQPNASKLFLNWFLSKEGQTLRQQIAAEVVPPTLRLDVTVDDMVDPSDAVDPQEEYVFQSHDPQYRDTRAEADARVREIYIEMRG